MFPINEGNELKRIIGDAFSEDFGGSRKDSKHGSPAGSKILKTGLKHLLKTLQNLEVIRRRNLAGRATDHFPRIGILIVHDRIFKGSEEVFLETEMRQFLLLQKVHRELSKCIQREEADVWVVMTTNLMTL